MGKPESTLSWEKGNLVQAVSSKGCYIFRATRISCYLMGIMDLWLNQGCYKLKAHYECLTNSTDNIDIYPT